MPKSHGQRQSVRQERKAAEDLGGRRTPASGATPHIKGDVQARGLKVECKTTSGLSYSLKRRELEKAQMEALTEGAMDWAMQVEFHLSPGFNRRYAVIDWMTYLDLRLRSAELEDLKRRSENG